MPKSNEQTEVGPGPDLESEAEPTVDQNELRMVAVERQQVLASLMADPEIRAVIEAKRAGKAPRVVLEDDSEKPEPKPEPEEDPLKDLPEDDPTRKVLGSMDRLIAKRVENLVTQRVEEALSKLDPRLAMIENVTSEVQKREVASQVQTARTKFKDFDQFRDDMVKLSKDNPGLGVEDLYILAKHKSGKLIMAERSTFSERPTGQPRRSTGTPNGKPPQRSPGKRGFHQILSEALGSLDLSQLGEKE